MKNENNEKLMGWRAIIIWLWITPKWAWWIFQRIFKYNWTWGGGNFTAQILGKCFSRDE